MRVASSSKPSAAGRVGAMTSATTTSVASQEADDGVEDCDNSVDNCHDYPPDAVDDGHDGSPDCANAVLDAGHDSAHFDGYLLVLVDGLFGMKSVRC